MFFVQTDSPINSSNSSIPMNSPPRVNTPMAHTNPPAGPRQFGSRARPSPFDFSMIHGAPHVFPEKYFNKLPRFNGSSAIPIEDHI